MSLKNIRIRIGLRTIKTAVAVVISMIIVYFYGATSSKLIFAMLGAMAAVMPTFQESLESCISQIIGVIFGALVGLFLVALPLNSLISTGIGIILVITVYNTLQIHYSPSLACFIVVMLCTSPETNAIEYAAGRIWDTAIGLAVGMLINTLIFPYDNSRQIRATVKTLDQETIGFMEDMFDGDNILPNVSKATRTIDDLARLLSIFSKQKLVMKMRRQQEELDAFLICQSKARLLLAHMEVLCQIPELGRLNLNNRQMLMDAGANIRDERNITDPTDADQVTNYHVTHILTLRQELLDQLSE